MYTCRKSPKPTPIWIHLFLVIFLSVFLSWVAICFGWCFFYVFGMCFWWCFLCVLGICFLWWFCYDFGICFGWCFLCVFGDVSFVLLEYVFGMWFSLRSITFHKSSVCTAHVHLNVYSLLHYEVKCLESQFSINDLILYGAVATFCWKETSEIEIGDRDWITLQMP